MSQRREEMLNAVDEFASVHNVWAEDQNRPNPDATYWDAFDELINVFETGGIPADCRELANAVSAFAVEEDAFSNRENTSTDYPHQAFWKAWDRVREIRKPKTAPPRRPMETVKQLHDQKVSHDQIAQMYGLFGPNGQPASWMIQKELDEPGSVVTAEVLERLEAKNNEEDDSQYERSEESIGQSLERKRRRSKDNERKPCPETAEELWLQKVPVPQAAQMLIKSEAEVQEMFIGFEKARDKRKADLAAQAAVKAVRGEQAESGDSDRFTESGNSGTDAKIASMIEQGFTKEQIVEELKVDGRTVAAAIRRLKPQAATA